MSTDEWSIQKNAVAIRISREMALDFGMVEPTPEEAAERAEQSARFAAQETKTRQQYREAVAALLGSQNPLVVALMHLHEPDLDARFSPECRGCDFAGYEGEPPDWPCRTVRTVAQHLSIELPDGYLPGAEYEPGDDQ